MDLHDLRKDYRWGALLESNVAANPIAQFKTWFEQYTHMDTPDNTAMVVSTVDVHGVPSTRVVLLKELTDDTFVFYTNYKSKKGQSLLANPNVSLLFFWPEMERQVRVTGVAEKLSAEKSDIYFRSRPFESRVSAIISPQSQVVPNREYLENLMFDFLEKNAENTILIRPENWGGVAVKPRSIEFWQGRPSRLHDRLLYTKQPNNSWIIERLAP
jgi:pyridoxamine 5'-phosphate oxidase